MHKKRNQVEISLGLTSLMLTICSVFALRGFALSGNSSLAASNAATNTDGTAQTAQTTSGSTAQSGPDPVIAAAGEIGQPGGAQAATAQLVLADPSISGVAVLGDLSENTGVQSDFASYWSPNWGKLNSIVLPTPGSHDYMVKSPYYYQLFHNKFGKWWSTNIGNWHMISLNSQEDHSTASAQNAWLRQDLAANHTLCTLAFENYPRFSSGSDFGSDSSLQPLWQTLYNSGVDIALAAESRHYERFNPMDPSGNLDTAKGIASFVVGTGGATLKPASKLEKNSAFRDAASNGILKLTLHKTSYAWNYVTTTGAVLDSGAGQCH